MFRNSKDSVLPFLRHQWAPTSLFRNSKGSASFSETQRARLPLFRKLKGSGFLLFGNSNGSGFPYSETQHALASLIRIQRAPDSLVWKLLITKTTTKTDSYWGRRFGLRVEACKGGEEWGGWEATLTTLGHYQAERRKTQTSLAFSQADAFRYSSFLDLSSSSPSCCHFGFSLPPLEKETGECVLVSLFYSSSILVKVKKLLHLFLNIIQC
ncbi:hypothetical protein CEXT_798651 [Caerostris extrusa]|uniref:Uncharacterized protein n=1 Tax=Caerostris extrusa TaxID=172846 RepID=A0AAV4R9S5_CAEEX|nr:hypothetical protein CEXT_798651 [Caerostris extrusa]